MKAKIRKTGEIVDVINFRGITHRLPGDRVSYIDSYGSEHYNERLNYYWDFEAVENPSANVDWQALRNQYVGMAMLGAMNFFSSIGHNEDAIAKIAVEMADALINELKKK